MYFIVLASIATGLIGYILSRHTNANVKTILVLLAAAIISGVLYLNDYRKEVGVVVENYCQQIQSNEGQVLMADGGCYLENEDGSKVAINFKRVD